MTEIESSSKIEKLANNRNEKLIIEYAFIDMRIQHKKELIITHLKEMANKKKEQKKISEMLKNPSLMDGKNGLKNLQNESKISKKIIKKQVNENRKTAANLLVNEVINNKNEDLAKKAVEAIKKVKSRGLRNRLKRKLGKQLENAEDYFKEIKEEMK